MSASFKPFVCAARPAMYSSVGSDDALEIFADKAQDPDKRFYNRTRFARLTATANYHDGPWSAKFAISGMGQEFIFERGTTQFVDVRQVPITVRGEAPVAGLEDVGVNPPAPSPRRIVSVLLPWLTTARSAF